MRTSPKYLILLFITVCVVAALYYLDRIRDVDPDIPSRGTDAAEEATSIAEVYTQGEVSNDTQIATYFRDFVYPTDNTRDPFQQTSTQIDIQQFPIPNLDRSTIALTGVIWDEENPFAIITDSKNSSHLVRVGEEIDKAKVLSIRPRSITIEREDKTKELILWPEEPLGMNSSSGRPDFHIPSPPPSREMENSSHDRVGGSP